MLIAIEGIDGAGKSTQARLLMDWLVDRRGHETGAIHLTKWNSSPFVSPAVKKAKKERALTPATFALLEAADLADRYDREIRPVLASGGIVVADRWVYTAFARGMARGLDAAWLRGIYSFAPKPDLCFFLAVPVEVALERITKTRFVKHYEAGMDQGLSEDPNQSFREFQTAGRAAYMGLQMAERCFIVINAQESIEEQHAAIVAAVNGHAAGDMAIETELDIADYEDRIWPDDGYPDELEGGAYV